jgi:hypothetical protein
MTPSILGWMLGDGVHSRNESGNHFAVYSRPSPTMTASVLTPRERKSRVRLTCCGGTGIAYLL